jgi:hypothetical protein
VPKGIGQAILVLPPFSTSDWSTLVLRKYLKKIGYQSHRWKQVTNVKVWKIYGFKDAMNDMSNSLSGLESRLRIPLNLISRPA